MRIGVDVRTAPAREVDVWSPDDTPARGERIADVFAERPGSGLSADGEPFRPYSARHAAARAARGLPVDRVDLRFTGRMLGGLVAGDASETEVTIRTAVDYAARVDADRPFIGVTEAEIDAVLMPIVEAHVDEALGTAVAPVRLV